MKGKTIKETKFTKEQIVNSNQFNVSEKDILRALLSGTEQYSISEAKKVIEKFKKKEVK